MIEPGRPVKDIQIDSDVQLRKYLKSYHNQGDLSQLIYQQVWKFYQK